MFFLSEDVLVSVSISHGQSVFQECEHSKAAHDYDYSVFSLDFIFISPISYLMINEGEANAKN